MRHCLTAERIADDVASVFGLRATVKLWPYQSLKVSMQRRGDFLEVKMCDLLKDAPEPVLRDIFVCLASRMSGTYRTFSDETVDYLQDGLLCKRIEFVARRTSLVPGSEGQYKDLAASYDRLVRMGLIQPVPGIALMWTDPIKQIKSGVSNSMRIVWVSGRLDDPAVPDHCIDAVLYSLICDICRDAFTESDADRLYRRNEAERRFPQFRELMEEAASYVNNCS